MCSQDSKTMYDLCWDEFSDDLRLTGHCSIEGAVGIAFCDTGNNLYDEGEVLYDACFGDCDGENGNIDVIGQGVEPWEDRNCNQIYDNEAEEIVAANNENDCDLVEYASWSSNQNLCYYDRGNQQWDDEETCYGDHPDCEYTGLYKRGFSPNYLLVSYEDQNNPNFTIENLVITFYLYKPTSNKPYQANYQQGQSNPTPVSQQQNVIQNGDDSMDDDLPDAPF